MKSFDVYSPKEEFDKELYKLFQKWHRVLKAYEEKYKNVFGKRNDLPYVYGERAQIGLLAIAAHQIGHFPLLEFIQDKNNKSGYGFQDMEIMTSDDMIWNVEAKYCQIKFNNKDFKGIVKFYMEEAVKDLRNIRRHRGIPINKRLAIVFVFSYGVSGDSITDISDFVSNIENVVKSWPKTGFAAIHFCKPENWTQSEHYDCPGIAIVGRQL